MPRKPKLSKLSCYIEPTAHKALRLEAVQREMTIGAIVEEALKYRIRIARHGTIGGTIGAADSSMSVPTP